MLKVMTNSRVPMKKAPCKQETECWPYCVPCHVKSLGLCVLIYDVVRREKLRLHDSAEQYLIAVILYLHNVCKALKPVQHFTHESGDFKNEVDGTWF